MKTSPGDIWRNLSYAQIAKLADAVGSRLVEWKTTGYFGDVKGMKAEEADKIGAWLFDMEIELARRRHEHANASHLPH